MIPIGRDPTGLLAQVMTWLPPFTPFVMMNRAASPPDWWVYLGTTLLMLASIAIGLTFAARLFRNGILMTGKPLASATSWIFYAHRPNGDLAVQPSSSVSWYPRHVAGDAMNRLAHGHTNETRSNGEVVSINYVRRQPMLDMKRR